MSEVVPVVSWHAADWLCAMWSEDLIRGYPVIPPVANQVDDLLSSAAIDATRQITCVGGGQVAASQVATCAAMAGCPIRLFPTVWAAANLWARTDPKATDLPGCGAVPTIVIAGTDLERDGFATGYGALGPGGRSNLVVSATLGLLGRFTGRVGDQTAFGLPGLGAYCIAGRTEGLQVAGVGSKGIAAATLAAPRGVYCGGADLQPSRIVRIMADALDVAMEGRQVGQRAYLVVLSPKIASAVRNAFAPGEFTQSMEAGAGHKRAGLEGLVVEAGADSQTWCALLPGPAGSMWTMDQA